MLPVKIDKFARIKISEILTVLRSLCELDDERTSANFLQFQKYY